MGNLERRKQVQELVMGYVKGGVENFLISSHSTFVSFFHHQMNLNLVDRNTSTIKKKELSTTFQ